MNAPCNGKVENSRVGADGEAAAGDASCTPLPAAVLAERRGLLEVNLLWPVPDLSSRAQEPHVIWRPLPWPKGERAERG